MSGGLAVLPSAHICCLVMSHGIVATRSPQSIGLTTRVTRARCRPSTAISRSSIAGSATSRSRSNDWEVDLSVQVPIFTGGQREIDLATAKYQIHEAELDRDQLAKTVEAVRDLLFMN